MRFLLFWGALALAFAGDGATHADWPQYGGTDSAWRYSALDQINTANVKRLAPVWAFQTGDYEDGLQATPIVIGGVLYLSTSRNSVYALDATDGRLIWRYKYPQPRRGRWRDGPQNRGVAVSDGKVIHRHARTTIVVALDQKTGRRIVESERRGFQTMRLQYYAAPLIVKDTVIVGGTGARFGASRLPDGVLREDGAAGMALVYDSGSWAKRVTRRGKAIAGRFGGGATWMTGSLRSGAQPGVLGHRQCGWRISTLAIAMRRRRGLNLYTDSVIALDPDTGSCAGITRRFPKTFGISIPAMNAC